MRKICCTFFILLTVCNLKSQSSLVGAEVILPDAPMPMMEAGAQSSSVVSATDKNNNAVIEGSVVDIKDEAINGVKVILVGEKNGVNQTTDVDAEGKFLFSGLPAGKYEVKIELMGEGPSVATNLELSANEKRVLPIVTTRTPTMNTTVHVSADRDQVALAEVQIEEKQRVLGVFPNFYTTYIWDSAPLTPKLKFNLAMRASFDPARFLGSGVRAGIEQARNTYPGYGQDLQGYGKRYGAAYADEVISDTLSRALLPSVFHQDPRYFYLGTGSAGSRVFYALKSAVITRGDDGHAEFNYSRILGGFATAGISNVYLAASDRSASTTLESAALITVGSAITNVVREFISRPLTTNAPAFAKGKQDAK